MSESREPGTEWVEVYSKTTGQKQTVPTEWLDHPVLGADFRKTPLTKAAEAENTKEK